MGIIQRYIYYVYRFNGVYEKKDGFPLDDAKFEIFFKLRYKNLKSIHLSLS
jgi:hypothetical protein